MSKVFSFTLLSLFTIFSLALPLAAQAWIVPGELKAQIHELSSSRNWLLLLHMKKNLWGHWKSQADGEEFFFAKNGKIDPEAEMLATLEHLDQNVQWGRLKTHPQCAFPARTQFLFENLTLNIQRQSCPEFEQWIKDLNAQSASLIFSSYYVGNPASLFGHTLLRLNTVPVDQLSTNSARLTDYGISFAAFADTDGGMLFAYKGLTGGYQGYFSLQPYYEKIIEYTKQESRDIWEYHLDFTRPELQRLLAHFWEIGYNNHFDYFFIDENCSYQILWLLEVARPSLDLTSDFPWYVLPADTIKVFNRYPNLVTAISYRPSFGRLLEKRWTALSAEQFAEVQKLLNGKTTPEQVKSKEVLEAYVAALRFKSFESKTEARPVFAEKTRLALVARSKLPGPSSFEEQTILHKDLPPRPDQGHGGQRWGIGISQSDGDNKQTRLDLSWNQGLHDLYARDQGYPPNSQIDFLKMKLSFQKYTNENWHFKLNEFRFIDITSLNPVKSFSAPMSWRLGIGAENSRFYSRGTHYVGQAQAAGGGAIDMFTDKFTFFYLAQFQSYAGDISDHFLIGPGWWTGFLARPSSQCKLWFSQEYFLDMLHHGAHIPFQIFEVGTSLFPKNFADIRLIGQQKLAWDSSQQWERQLKLEFFYAY